MGRLYQYANRLAHVYFLRERGVEAWLIDLCFIDDHHRPTSLEAWQRELPAVKRELGFANGKVPRTVDIFLPAIGPGERTRAG